MRGKPWVLGTRGSPLALAQARWVQAQLQRQVAGTQVELRVIRTLGDRHQEASVKAMDAKGIFTREIEEALLDGKIDFAVHSMKDLPVQLPAGLALGPVPAREDVRDALVSREKKRWKDLPQGARVGTGSSRRALQLLLLRPDLCIVEVRGNVQTRIKRVAPGDLDAVILARAGLQRLQEQENIAEVFEIDSILPAVGQGALALEMRQGDEEVFRLLDSIKDANATFCVQAERVFLAALGGGCRVPIGGHALWEDGKLTLWGGVFSARDGQCFKGMRLGDASQAEELGKILAEDLLAQGAREILARA